MPKTTFYKISLRPLGRFFFGGELVLGAANAQAERQRTYLVHSRYLPQQTTLLGVLREHLLRSNDLLLRPTDNAARKAAAAAIVGDTGFRVQLDEQDKTAIKATDTFGAIAAISPLVLQDETDGSYWQPAPLDDGRGKDDRDLKWQENQPLKLKNLDAKEGLPLCFHNQQGQRKPLDEMFAEQHQVGITVTNRRKWREDREKEEAYFRQTFHRNRSTHYRPDKETDTLSPPRSEFSFCFWVALNEEEDSSLKIWQNGPVTMGGERSTFQLTCEEAPQIKQLQDVCFSATYQQNTTVPNGYQRFSLLSDTYLPAGVLQQLKVFTVAEPVGFRFFSTTLSKTSNYYQLAKEENSEKWKDSGRSQSQLYNLLGRGGVLLVPTDNANKLETIIKNQTAFRQIGYNYFQNL